MAIVHFVNYKKGTQSRAAMRGVMLYVMQEKKSAWEGEPLVSGINCQPQDAVRLRLLRNEKALDVFAAQAEKALYSLIRFIHIDFRLRQLFLHGSEIALPVGRGNKSVCFAIGVQPYLGNAVDVCFSQFSNHDNLSASSHSVRRQALSGSPR